MEGERMAGLLHDWYCGGRPSGNGVLGPPQLGNGLGLCEEVEALATVEIHLAEKRCPRTCEREHRQRNWNWNIHSHLTYTHTEKIFCISGFKTSSLKTKTKIKSQGPYENQDQD